MSKCIEEILFRQKFVIKLWELPFDESGFSDGYDQHIRPFDMLLEVPRFVRSDMADGDRGQFF